MTIQAYEGDDREKEREKELELGMETYKFHHGGVDHVHPDPFSQLFLLALEKGILVNNYDDEHLNVCPFDNVCRELWKRREERVKRETSDELHTEIFKEFCFCYFIS